MGFSDDFVLYCISVFVFLNIAHSVELNFELPDNEEQCFHELIDAQVEVNIEYQVIAGGNYDVDMELLSPSGSVLYKETKQQYDSYTWTTDSRGEYKFCFSNEFSTFTHKQVYFNLQVGDAKQVDKALEIQHVNTMTQLETSAVNMHDSLKTIADYQTHQRLRETQGRIFAEAISERVQWWSLGQSMVIVVVGVGQVVVLRSFFPDRKR